jgi:hypothetical protein
MNQDLDALTLIRDLSTNEFERFKAALHILVSRTFIIRGIEKERELYDFTIRNSALFEAWLSCMDASLVSDESLGVIAYRGPGNTRLYFSREEICAFLALRQLYEDKKQEIFLSAFPVVTVADFRKKYNAMTGEEIKKTALGNVLHRLSTCKLIGLDPRDYEDLAEGLIRLYPSIPLSLGRDALDEAIAFLGNREKPEESSGEEEEEE